uniref:Uncharacterized protein n=1 Tax=Lepeophtheirus salmonis TaxID=72036 RepID=A0A0K2TIN4_LEPSM
MSNSNVAPGGITSPAPRSPYAKCEGTTKCLSSPGHTPIRPLSHPGITLPFPKGNVKGFDLSNEESNFVPSLRNPP